MLAILRGRWIITILLGYVGWVVAYNIQQYTMFVAQFSLGWHLMITLVAIFLVAGVLTALLMLAGDNGTIQDGLSLAIPWFIIYLVFDFTLSSYYNSWVIEVESYALTRAWQLLLVPLACVLTAVGTSLFMHPKEVIFTPAHTVARYRK